MADAAINRLTLRIIRRGGWSWGADPMRWVDIAKSRLAHLIAERLVEQVPDGTVISAPISLTLRAAELGKLDGEAAAFPGTALDLGHEIDRQLSELLPVLVAERQAEHRTSIEPVETPDTGQANPDVVHANLVGVLREWYVAGSLERLLTAIDVGGLTLILEVLINELPPAIRADLPVTTADLIDVRHGHPSEASASRLSAGLRAVILGFTRFLAEDPSDVPRERVLTLMEKWLDPGMPLRSLDDADKEVSTDGGVAAGCTVPSRADAEWERTAGESTAPYSSVPDVASVVEMPVCDVEMQVESILPFLVAGTLEQLGYWNTLDALLDASNENESARLFALGFAYKLMPPPERGWYRSPKERAAANAFAARAADRNDDGLPAFARRSESILSPLNGLLYASLAAGHDPAAPLVMYEVEDGLILFDSEGLFPLRWLDQAGALGGCLEQLDNPIVLVSSRSPRTAAFEYLESSKKSRVVTDIHPVEPRSWSRVRDSEGAYLWLNSECPDTGSFRERISRFSDHFDRIEVIVDKLLAQRAAVAPDSTRAFERAMWLCCCVGLGSIAWTLWGREGGADPVLALERFGDLGGTVRFDVEKISVKMPLGRRFLDLRDAGLLTDIRSLPWLGGRTVEFDHG